jgi:glycosyltransferase involved in cell wall biosynthesis
VNKRKILVFAHVPPPHHGQSVMVQVLLEGLRADSRFEVHHVDARVSDDLEDVGSFRPQKFVRLFKCVLQSWWIRMRYGRMAFYYVPAPAKRSAILRDWVVMALCRPLFPELILHWHAYGLGEWATSGKDLARQLTQRALGKATMSIVLSKHNIPDAARLAPLDFVIVPNGIPDPCPDFDKELLPLRQAGGVRPLRCLFLAHCTRAKGLFDALEAVALVNDRKLLSNKRITLTVAGMFVDEAERRAFEQRIQLPDLRTADGSPVVNYVGFLKPEAKDAAFRSHDCLLVPSHWESFGLTVVEAAAYGLPSVTSDHANLVGLLPEGLGFSGKTGDVEDLSSSIVGAAEFNGFADLRREFVERYRSERFVRDISEALMSVQK